MHDYDYNQNQDPWWEKVREIAPQDRSYACIEQILLTFEQLETSIQDLEKRLQMVKEEVKILISEK